MRHGWTVVTWYWSRADDGKRPVAPHFVWYNFGRFPGSRMPKAVMVREMFGSIAPRYDRLNRILSLGIDQSWRRRTCDTLAVAPGEIAADLCCGTGDLALELAGRGATVVAVDFSYEMLRIAADKGVANPAGADCLRLPFPSG